MRKVDETVQGGRMEGSEKKRREEKKKKSVIKTDTERKGDHGGNERIRDG